MSRDFHMLEAKRLFKARRSLYARFAGCTVSNAGTFEEVIQQILEVTAP